MPNTTERIDSHSTAVQDLLAPARLGSLALRNHLVMAPLTRNRAAADGTPEPLMATYYAQRATAGLIIAEASTPNAVGQTYPNITAIHTPAHVTGWRQVTDAVRESGGGPLFLQLQHGGRVGHPATSGLTPVAPSPVPLPGTIFTPDGHQSTVTPREMTVGQIHSTVADFASAARNAVAAGFAGVEVHSANGHLLHQFLSRTTNHRTDEYGGTVAGRIRFAVEVVRAVAEAIGPERTGVRVSPANTVNGIEIDPDPADGTDATHLALVDALVDALGDTVGGPGRLAYLHIVHADPDIPLFGRIRAAWPGPLIANPVLPAKLSVTAIDRAAGRLLAAGADLIALGRPFLANPDLVTRLRLGAPLNQVRDRYLMYTGGATGYTDYPALDTADA